MKPVLTLTALALPLVLSASCASSTCRSEACEESAACCEAPAADGSCCEEAEPACCDEPAADGSCCQEEVTAAAWSSHGAALSGGSRLSLAQLLEGADAYDGETVRVEGVVDGVCPKKGCWMTMSAGQRQMRVSFRDYGFFVPLDSAGKRVRLEGTFTIEEIPVDEARHYLEDAGRAEEAAAISEPRKGFVFVADGVQIEQAG